MPLDDEFVLAGTGSRSLLTSSPEIRHRAVARTEMALSFRQHQHGARLIVMSGMAEGFDHLLAVTALRLGIDLWCVIPHRGYGDYYWRRNSLTGRDMFAEFCRIRDTAIRVTYAAESLYVNGRHSNFVRNDQMIEAADEFLVWNPSSKGTAHCLAGIQRAGLPYEILSA